MYYFLLTVAAILLGADFSLCKIYQKKFGANPTSVFFFNAISGFATAVIFFVINGFKLNFSLYSFIMAGCMNALVMLYNIIYFKLLKYGSVSAYTVFLMSGGMLLPYVFGLIFLNESFSSLRTVGLIVILVGVILSNFRYRTHRY